MVTPLDQRRATLVVALLPAARGAQTGRPQGSPLQQAMLEDDAYARTL